MDFVFDLPAIPLALALIVIMCGLALGGLICFRRYVLPRLHFVQTDTDISVALVPSIMVIYGLVMALISVHVWEANQDVQSITSREATTLAALYRDASEYPEPTRGQIQGAIRSYTEYVIREAWPQQRQGIVPTGGVALVDRLQAAIIGFEPASESQKILAAETFSAYNRMVESRRMRLEAVHTHLPAVMWTVILFGAMICFFTSYCFAGADSRVHALLVLLLAVFVALLVFLTVALDRPFRGDLGISSRPYQLVYDQLMKG